MEFMKQNLSYGASMPHKPQPLSSTAWLLFVGAGGGDGGGGEGGGGGDGGAASVQAIVPLDCG